MRRPRQGVEDDADFVACGQSSEPTEASTKSLHPSCPDQVPWSTQRTQTPFGIAKPLRIGEPPLDPLENEIGTRRKQTGLLHSGRARTIRLMIRINIWRKEPCVDVGAYVRAGSAVSAIYLGKLAAWRNDVAEMGPQASWMNATPWRKPAPATSGGICHVAMWTRRPCCLPRS